MDNTGKIVRNNLLLFVIYTLLIHATAGREAAFMGAMTSYAHAGCIFVVGFFMAIFSAENRSLGGALILSALLITIIGFSVCLGTFDLRLH